MRTENCVKGWVELMVNGFTKENGKLVANSCHAEGEIFISYSTPIAKFCGDHFELAKKKYSATTSKQQTYLRRHIPNGMLVEVDHI